jgi:hypothetical protein
MHSWPYENSAEKARCEFFLCKDGLLQQFWTKDQVTRQLHLLELNFLQFVSFVYTVSVSSCYVLDCSGCLYCSSVLQVRLDTICTQMAADV